MAEVERRAEDRRRTPKRRMPKTTCPHCGHGFSTVEVVKLDGGKRGPLRRRRCENCRWTHWTVEQIDPLRKPRPPIRLS